jgi:hypothetical protein
MKYTRKRKRSKRRTKLRGGFIGLDPRGSFLPTPLTDLSTSIGHYFNESNNAYSGAYKGIDPNWWVQPRLR